MASVFYSRRGEKDVAEILRHLTKTSLDAQEYAEQVAKILKEIEKLAETPMLGKQVPGIETDYRSWLIFNNRYRVYFERLTPNSIYIGLIKRAVALEPKLETIKNSFKNRE